MIQDWITYILIGSALVYVFYQAFRILGRQSQGNATGCGGCSSCESPHVKAKDPVNPEMLDTCKNDLAISEK
jgi:hypothetical protein